MALLDTADALQPAPRQGINYARASRSERVARERAQDPAQVQRSLRTLAAAIELGTIDVSALEGLTRSAMARRDVL